MWASMRPGRRVRLLPVMMVAPEGVSFVGSVETEAILPSWMVTVAEGRTLSPSKTRMFWKIVVVVAMVV